MRARVSLAGIVALALAAGAPSASAAGVPAQLSEAESEAAARIGAEAALAAFVPPPGSLPAPIAPPTSTPGNDVRRAASWTVPEQPVQAIGWVKAHPPGGSQLNFTENLEGGTPIASIPTSIGFRWPAVPRARAEIELHVTAQALPGGASGLEAVADGYWLTPRSPAEAIPAGMRLLRITAASSIPGNDPRQPPLAITGRAQIERVATVLNELPPVQPLGPGVVPVVSCPVSFGITLRLAFYAHRSDSPPAAVVRDELGGCGKVRLALAGHEERPLEEAESLPGLIERALGRRLHLEPRRQR